MENFALYASQEIIDNGELIIMLTMKSISLELRFRWSLWFEFYIDGVYHRIKTSGGDTSWTFEDKTYLCHNIDRSVGVLHPYAPKCVIYSLEGEFPKLPMSSRHVDHILKKHPHRVICFSGGRERWRYEKLPWRWELDTGQIVTVHNEGFSLEWRIDDIPIMKAKASFFRPTKAEITAEPEIIPYLIGIFLCTYISGSS